MTESNSQRKFEAAIELNLLKEEQVKAVQQEQAASNMPALEIAIRKGFIKRRQLEMLEAFANPTQVVPGYRIDGILGQGGAGTVYKATQLRLDRPVAIKTINRASARNDLTPKRFEREAKIVGQLRHPNIISAFDFGVHDHQLYLVMEFVDGIDAEKLLKEKESIPEIHGWHIAKQVCNALENAQQHGVIHRDIKPANLILTTAPVGTQIPANVPFVKVADFGLAKFNDKQVDAAITMEQAVSGTPFYMSPEQIQAEKIDHRSDIYSLGATIWHLVTGAPPVTGTGPLDVITSKMKLEDDWLAKSPPEISAAGFSVLKKMCRHDREQRIDDYTELNREIESVIEQLGDPDTGSDTAEMEAGKTFVTELPGLPKQDGRKPKVKPANSGSRGRLWSWMVGALGLIILLASIGYVVLSDTEREPAAFVRLTEFAGPPIFLFNGRKVNPTQKFTGTWSPDKGVEGEAILSGIGTRDFRSRDNARKPLGDFQFVCGFRHNKSEAIGFRFLDDSNNVYWEVHIQPDHAMLQCGDFKSRCPVQEFDENKSVGYHQFRLESQPDHWRIEIDNEMLGEVPKPPKLKDSAQNRDEDFIVQLFVDGTEPAHFEHIQFRRYESKKPANAQ